MPAIKLNSYPGLFIRRMPDVRFSVSVASSAMSKHHFRLNERQQKEYPKYFWDFFSDRIDDTTYEEDMKTKSCFLRGKLLNHENIEIVSYGSFLDACHSIEMKHFSSYSEWFCRMIAKGNLNREGWMYRLQYIQMGRKTIGIWWKSINYIYSCMSC